MKKKDTIPKIFLVTLGAIWVIQLSVIGRFLFSVKLNLSWSVDWMEFLRFCILIISTICYAVSYYHFEKFYQIAKEKDQKNFLKWEKDATIERKRIGYYLWKGINPFLFWIFLLIFVLLFSVYLFIKKDG